MMEHFKRILILITVYTAIPLCALAVPLHPGDKVAITVFNHPELLTQGQLDQNGAITLPLAGSVIVGGLEPDAADRAIENALRRYLRYPAVDIAVTEPSALARQIAVGGQVAKPGNVVMTSGNSLVAAIYDAGGPLQNADFSHVSVLHGGSQKIYDVAAVEKGDMSQDPQLADGDVVFVPKSKRMDMSTIFSGIAALRYLVVP